MLASRTPDTRNVTSAQDRPAKDTRRRGSRLSWFMPRHNSHPLPRSGVALFAGATYLTRASKRAMQSPGTSPQRVTSRRWPEIAAWVKLMETVGAILATTLMIQGRALSLITRPLQVQPCRQELLLAQNCSCAKLLVLHSVDGRPSVCSVVTYRFRACLRYSRTASFVMRISRLHLLPDNANDGTVRRETSCLSVKVTSSESAPTVTIVAVVHIYVTENVNLILAPG